MWLSFYSHTTWVWCVLFWSILQTCIKQSIASCFVDFWQAIDGFNQNQVPTITALCRSFFEERWQVSVCWCLAIMLDNVFYSLGICLPSPSWLPFQHHLRFPDFFIRTSLVTNFFYAANCTCMQCRVALLGRSSTIWHCVCFFFR